MLNQARFLFSSAHYGYLNSDILVSTELFRTLHECQHLVSRGVVKPNYLLAGRVHEIDISLIPSIPTSSEPFDSIVFRLANSSRAALRHIHSADYFVFSSAMDLSKLHNVVVGRSRIDNYLMDVPRRQGGSLIDATLQIPAVHQGLCGFMCRAKPMRLSFMNHNWNRFYLLSPWVG
ncbi:uncharacterized protein [Blastocystis hominis]|uniref:Uncharacterized protein n=1 Tax=Blastocystis hominis TaxID=12968 RepID=D8M9K6_BLAHO|nr:uncharacterized protein [Blastocystis hominis]CBK24745.2 unnamed protein product [Blastocystis hominis]|eukprot:XP_012898793.1 uncharacterized protein [Blastocystis hominis]